MQATPREWYISNTGKEEIEVEGYIITKEIPIVLDPKIAAANPGVAQTLTAYVKAKMDNDLDALLVVIEKPNQYSGEDLQKKYTNIYNKYPGAFLFSSYILTTPTKIGFNGKYLCSIEYSWIDPDDNSKNLWILTMEYDGTIWWIAN